MRAVVQRVRSASVIVIDGQTRQRVGQIDEPGLMILLGVGVEDAEPQADSLAAKIAHLRILDGERSLVQAAAPALVVSQFTLYGDVRKGRRPSWTSSARPEQAEPLYERFVHGLQAEGVPVERGCFGAQMDVQLVNDGPFTLIVDTDDLAGPRRA